MSFPLTQKYRLKKSSEFDLLFKNISSVSAPLMSLYYKKSKNNNVKIGFSVGKKTHKLAVNRNKIKRLMREVFRINASEYISHTLSYNIAIIYTGTEIPSFQEVESSMKSLLLSFKNKALS